MTRKITRQEAEVTIEQCTAVYRRLLNEGDWDAETKAKMDRILAKRDAAYAALRLISE